MPDVVVVYSLCVIVLASNVIVQLAIRIHLSCPYQGLADGGFGCRPQVGVGDDRVEEAGSLCVSRFENR